VGFNGLPVVPTGLLKDMPDLNLTYTIVPSEAQPVLVVKQQTNLAIKPFSQSLNMSMVITNAGNATAWGALIGTGKADLSTLVTTLSGVHIPKGCTIQYEVRGFSIPSLIQTNYLGAYYGAQNLLLEYNTLTGSGASTYIAIMRGLDTNHDGFLDLHEAGLLGPTAPINYILPGQSITIDLSSISGQYAPFANETGMFSAATILAGTEQGPNTARAAEAIDGVTWNVASVPVASQDDITINFTFSNVTNNVVQNKIAALGFTYVGTLNTSVYGAGTASFAIYNYTDHAWIAVSTLVTPAVSINQTGQLPTVTTFTIINGSKYATNQVVNISDFMHGRYNTVTLQLQIVNDVPTLDQIDAMSMNYLQENKSVLPIAPKTVGYTDLSSIVLRKATSNSLYGGATNASVLLFSQQIVSPDSSPNHDIFVPGAVENLTATVVNVGTETAMLAEFTMLVPGIIVNPGNFTVIGNILFAIIPFLPPNATASLTFQFRVPNSEIIPGMAVAYNNQTKVNLLASDYAETANDLYVDAALQYTNAADTRPCIIPVNATTTLESAVPAATGENFTVACTVSMANVPSWLGFLNLSVPKTPYFTTSGVPYNVTTLSAMKGSFLRTFTKASVEGYLLPDVALATNQLSALMRLAPVPALPIGSVQITVQKQVTYNGAVQSSSFTIIRGDEINVTVTATNAGTLPVGVDPAALAFDDGAAFDSKGFTLASGNTSTTNITLAPGASQSFTYVLQAKAVGTFSLNATRITYLFLVQQTATSNTFTVAVQEQLLVIIAYVGIPVAAILIIVGVVRSRKKRRTVPKDIPTVVKK
jgi:hypothetical protein